MICFRGVLNAPPRRTCPRGASRASGPRNRAGGRCRPAHPQPAADRAWPASRPGPPVPPDPGAPATRPGSCQGCCAGSKPHRPGSSHPGRRYDRVRRPCRQRGCPRSPQIVEQAAARSAIPGRSAVANALIHVAVVGLHDLVVVGVAGREDALAVVIDREPVDAAGDQQPQQSGQDGRHVHQVQYGVGDQHIGRRPLRPLSPVSGLQVPAELGVLQAHPQITHLQPIRPQVAAQAPRGRPIAQPPARIIQQRPIRIQQDVLAGAEHAPVHQTGHHRSQAGANLQHPRRARGHETAQLGQHMPVKRPVIHGRLRGQVAGIAGGHRGFIEASQCFSATIANLRTRPLPSQSLHS